MNSKAVPAIPRYLSISPKAYEHPSDRAATAALGSIPLLDKVLKKLSEFRFEKSFEQLLLADAIKIGERQLPEIWKDHCSVLASLDIDTKPDVYLRPMATMNAMTVGSSKPVVILNSGLVSALSGNERLAVLGHEAGHIHSDHVHYATVMNIIQRLLATGMSPIGKLPLQAVLYVLLEWYRCAELSCDRAATIVVDDPLATCRVLMNVAGGGVKDLNLDAFLTQAGDYAETEDLMSRPGRWLTELNRTHPYTVRRVGELMRWVQEGELDRIRAGSYVRRGQEPPPNEQFKAATEHYRKRFTEILDRAAGGVQKIAGQFSSWARNDSDSP